MEGRGDNLGHIPVLGLPFLPRPFLPFRFHPQQRCFPLWDWDRGLCWSWEVGAQPHLKDRDPTG